MAATFTWQGADEDGTASVSEPFDIGGTGSTILFSQSRDWAIPVASSPIPAGESSIERYIRAKFTGSFTNISDVKFWRSDGNALNTGVTIRAGGLADGNGLAWAVPVTTANADAAVPTSEPGSTNVDVDASGATRYAPALITGADRWIRLQVGTTGLTPAGAVSGGTPNIQFSMKYTES